MPQADSNPAGKTNIPISIGSARSSCNASMVAGYNDVRCRFACGGVVVVIDAMVIYIYIYISLQHFLLYIYI